MTTIDLWLSIMGETNSHEHYFMLKHGVLKKDFVNFILSIGMRLMLREKLDIAKKQQMSKGLRT